MQNTADTRAKIFRRNVPVARRIRNEMHAGRMVDFISRECDVVLIAASDPSESRVVVENYWRDQCVLVCFVAL